MLKEVIVDKVQTGLWHDLGEEGFRDLLLSHDIEAIVVMDAYIKRTKLNNISMLQVQAFSLKEIEYLLCK